MTLKSEFSWFLDKEFNDLREGFKPETADSAMKPTDGRLGN